MLDHELSEDDVSVKLITPAIVQAGWDEATQIRRQVFFTKGPQIRTTFEIRSRDPSDLPSG